ncbi:MAG: SDR family oxidoreductase, partial [Ruminococcus sp.]|nr:SDR family oxidoreductase [Ruminococcus sp.]
RAVGKHMATAGNGKIVNISSVIGENCKPKFSDYAASKSGIIGYTKSVAQELGPMGVNVNCVSPGFIQRGQFSENQLPYLLKSNFMNKVGCSEDVASAVAFLASEEADFITGQNLCVDGGRSLGLHGDN